MAFQNFYATKTQTAIGASDTVIQVQTPPTVTSGRIVLEPRNAQLREIISYTGVAGTTLTGVTRGLFGTTAKPHSSGVLIEMNFLAQDYQDLVDAFNSFASTNGSGWYDSTAVVSSVTYNNNGSYLLTTTADQSSLWSPGMRLRFTRNTPVPTQSALFNGTTHYFNRAAPAGMTFTDDFVVSAWVKLDSYSSSPQVICSRFNGTSGWSLQASSVNGCVSFVGFNGSSSNYSDIISVQSIPLGRWVHIAAQLDMSSYTMSPTTSWVMIDGVDVPAVISRGGTNPTSLVQAGNLEIGSRAGGLLKFAGGIAQVAIYGTKVTQANVRATISQVLTGSEPGIISAYSLSNSLNDLSATANNLTAFGSATTTNNDAPWGNQANGTVSSTVDYGIIMAINGTSVTVQTPTGSTIPTSGTIANVKYATVKSPYGMPVNVGAWRVAAYFVSQLSRAITSSSWVNIVGVQLVVPVGRYVLGYQLTSQLSLASGTASARTTLSYANNTEGTLGMISVSENVTVSNSIYASDKVNSNGDTSFTSPTIVYCNMFSSGNGTVYIRGDISRNTNVIYADNAYL